MMNVKSSYVIILLFMLTVGYLIYPKSTASKLIEPIKNHHITNKTIVIVGGGLAGLIASLTIANEGHQVILVEKAKTIGGNSIKASSGISAANTIYQHKHNIKDSENAFENNMLVSAGDMSNKLIHTLAKHGSKAINLLASYNIPLNEIVRLGGHTYPRTHKVIGVTIIKTLEKEIRKHKNIHLITGAEMTSFIINNKNIIEGIVYNNTQKLYCNGVILTTGGFAANHNLITKHRPDFRNIIWTTNSDVTTGDIFTMSNKLNIKFIDMNKIQLHPTGFIDPKDPSNKSKILAPEILRAKGSILINTQGQRFCNELAQRDQIITAMNKFSPKLFYLILTDTIAKQIDTLSFYVNKGLLKKIKNFDELSFYTKINKNTLIKQIKSYNAESLLKNDKFGKKYFENTPFDLNGIFYIGIVTPVVHYCMGGVKIDGRARVLDTNDMIIPNLYAAGEVTGGIHRNNRLGGVSLLDCVVFGRIAGLTSIETSSNSNIVNDIKKIN